MFHTFLVKIGLILSMILSPFMGQHFGSTLPNTNALFETSLANGQATTDTTMTLSLGTDRAGNTLSGYTCFIVDEGTPSAEFECGTAAGTSITSVTRGIDTLTGTTSVTALKFSHRRGADVKISDYPVLGIHNRILQGIDTLPNVLYYTPSRVNGDFTTTTQIVDKGYVDSVAIAGAANATEGTKGIVDLATQIQMASSTNLGGSGASLVLQSRYATSSPGTAGLWTVITQNTGKIAQAFLDLTANFTWTGAHTWNTATSTFNATTTRTAPEVGTFGLSIGTTTATSSGNLVVTNNSSTTNLVISGACTGCSNGYEIKTATGSGPSGSSSSGQDVAVSATCSSGKQVVGGGGTETLTTASLILLRNYPSATSTWTVDYIATANGLPSNTITAYAICVNP